MEIVPDTFRSVIPISVLGLTLQPVSSIICIAIVLYVLFPYVSGGMSDPTAVSLLATMVSIASLVYSNILVNLKSNSGEPDLTDMGTFFEYTSLTIGAFVIALTFLLVLSLYYGKNTAIKSLLAWIAGIVLVVVSSSLYLYLSVKFGSTVSTILYIFVVALGAFISKDYLFR